MSRFTRFAAIDWSGAKGLRHKGIALATCAAGRDAPMLVAPPGPGWARAEILDWILAQRDDLLIGFDLGPSLPFVDRGAYFPGWADSPADARALWALVERVCADDPDLAASSFVDHAEASRHFRRHGGRVGDLFGQGRGRLRITEHAQQAQGLNPYSNLNLVGAAQVGKSSLTGMRLLHRIEGKLPIWPFDPLPASGPVVVEIYTSIAALAGDRPRGRTKMRSIADLNAALTAPSIGSDPFPGAGRIDDHATDAILAAAWLRANAGRAELWSPPGLTPAVARTEGWTFGVV